jgi:CoA:oxalate CoA-transferase
VRHASDPSLGEFDLPAFPVKFSDWPERTDLKASKVGEDNEAVLRDLLGLSDAAISELYSAKVLIKAPAPATAPASAS